MRIETWKNVPNQSALLSTPKYSEKLSNIILPKQKTVTPNFT